MTRARDGHEVGSSEKAIVFEFLEELDGEACSTGRDGCQAEAATKDLVGPSGSHDVE